MSNITTIDCELFGIPDSTLATEEPSCQPGSRKSHPAYTVSPSRKLSSSMMEFEPADIRLAVRGDRDALCRWAERSWTPMVALSRSIVGEGDAEDAVQEGLLVAWNKLGELRKPEAFPAWMARVVTRICLRRAARPEAGSVSLELVPEASTGDDGRDPETELDIERLLGALAPQQRAVMHLTVVEGMTDGEIAALLRIRPASVRSHRRRARQRLSQLLEGGRGA